MVENEDIESIESEELWERWRCEVDKGQGKERIDKYLAEHMTNTSRNRIQTAADAGNVWVNGTPVASNYRVKLVFVLTSISPASASYFKRDFCTAYLHKKVPQISELFGYKKSSRTLFLTVREQLFVEITGKYGILAP